MRRSLFTLALAGVFGVLLASDASACCHKKKCAAPCPPPAPAPCVVEVAPCPPPAPVCEPAPKKCGLFHHNTGCGHQKIKIGGLCHKKAACPPPAPVCVEAPVTYAAPVVYAAPQQVWAAPQASGQN